MCWEFLNVSLAVFRKHSFYKMIPERDTDDEVGGGEDHHSTAQSEVRVGRVLLIVLDGLYL